MLDLKSVTGYIKETTDILAIATGMEVIICDVDSRVLGDSNLEDVKELDFREDLNHLSHHSIVREAIQNQKQIILMDSKHSNSACLHCVNAHTCQISSIIAYPIIDGAQTVGGIGLYATKENAKKLIANQTEVLVEFLQKISEMLLNKIREAEHRIAFQGMNERLRLLIESLDDAIVGLDENGTVININSRFCKIFSAARDSIHKASDLYSLFGTSEFEHYLHRFFLEGKPQKALMKLAGQEILISCKPVVAENIYKGGLIYFKKSNDIYKEARSVKNLSCRITFCDIAGSSPASLQLKQTAEHFAKSPSTIFIQGKSGTGKEMYARAIHSASLVAKGPFVAVNCAAIPENLLESELFGHKEGAFTGSMRGGRIGKFQLADHGTLFLDEIGEIPLHLQPKLLRAIQERAVQPIGSDASVPVSIRIIAATNQDIEAMVKRGEFREDLYYRLNVIPLYIPELKNRREDIFELLDVFLEKYNRVLDKNIIGFDDTARQLLCSYDWPGNVRELQNTVEYAVNDCNGLYISPEHLPRKSFAPLDKTLSLKLQPLKEVEACYIRQALRQFGNTPEGKNAAAKALGISRATFYRRLSQLGLSQ